MLTSDGLAELKYQDILDHQVMMTDTATMVTMTRMANIHIACLGTAILTALIMGCCALLFMPDPQRHQR